MGSHIESSVRKHLGDNSHIWGANALFTLITYSLMANSNI